MKKTLQINLAGITFNIEEDAYSKLNQYLKSIQQYFSTYESSEEIIKDIETRIAEKFFAKTKPEGTQIIEIEDVNQIIKSMGNVSDFEAIEEEEDLSKSKGDQSAKTEFGAPKNPESVKTQFYRDSKRKALGGVLSGFAHNFSVDVVWLRVIFIILAFGLIGAEGAGGFFFIAYIICWIAFPQRDDLEENEKIKKFYRNPENKVIGGVSTGLASYFGVDLSVIRLIFVVSAFFGVGILIYIILWIAAPTAVTLTQKMEMKGQPVTLENIETNIKSSLNTDPSKPESSLTKILLFPFRLIGMILKGLGQVLQSLGPLVRIIAGLIVLVLGASLLFASLLATAVFFGVASSSTWLDNNHFFGAISNDLPQIGGFFGFLVTAIPAAAITIVGISLLTNQRQGTRNFWLSGLALWFAGIVGIGVVGSKYAMNFSRNYKEQVIEKYNTPGQILFLDVINNEDDFDDDFNFRFDVDVDLETADGQELVLEKYISAKGSTKKNAMENAKNISYKITQKDSVLYFPRSLTLTGKKVIRDQRVSIDLAIPRNKKFKMSEEFVNSMLRNHWDLAGANGINNSEIEDFTFIMGDDDKIECLDCPKLTEEEREALRNNDFNDAEVIDNNDFSELGQHHKTYELKDFKNIEVGSAIRIMVKKGANYSVEVYAQREEDLKDLVVKTKGNTLSAEYDDSFINNRDHINMIVTLPEIEDLYFSGASKAKVIGFDNENKVDISLSGASKAAVDIETRELVINLSGASKLEARGKADYLHVEANGASKFEGKRLEVKKAKVSASGASKANLGKVDDLDSDTSGGSKISRE